MNGEVMDRRKLLWRLSNCPKLWLTRACSAYATRTRVPFCALTVVLSRPIRERHPSGRCEILVVIPFIISIFKEFERRHIRSVVGRRKNSRGIGIVARAIPAMFMANV
jgi:hypothetical protein